MPLVLLLRILEIASVCSFAVLAVHLVRSSRFLSLPFFAAYCALMVVDLAWHPLTIAHGMWIQPWILALEFCAVIEAAALASDKIREYQRRELLLFLLFIGLAGAARGSGFYSTADAAGWYRAVTQQVRVGLAVLCVAICLYELFNRDIRWDRLWIPHLRILGAYMVMRGIWSFMARPGMGALIHRQIRIAWLVAVCAWACVWLFYDRRELRAARFKALYSTL